MYLVPPSVVSSPTDITKSMREMKPILFTGVHFCAIICSKDGHQNPIYNQNWKESSAVLALLKGNANLRNKFSLAQLPGDFGIKTYWNTKSTHCLGSSTAQKVWVRAEFPAGFLLLSSYPLKVHEDKSRNIWKLSHLEITRCLTILHTLSLGWTVSPALHYQGHLFNQRIFVFHKRCLPLLFIRYLKSQSFVTGQSFP